MKKNEQIEGLSAEKAGQRETNTQVDESFAQPGQLNTDENWKLFKEHHLAAGEAFNHFVLAAIQVCLLKLALPRGKFGKVAADVVPEVCERTLRNYRQLGERFLSSVHERVMTVSALREDGTLPDSTLCAEDAVKNYLAQHKLQTAEDLKAHAEKVVPDLVHAPSKRRISRVENTMAKVRRAWSRMDAKQRPELKQRFAEFVAENAAKQAEKQPKATDESPAKQSTTEEPPKS